MKYTFIPLKLQFPCRLWKWLWYIHAMTVIVQPSFLSPLPECVFVLATLHCFSSGVGKRVTWAHGCLPVHVHALRHHAQPVLAGGTELKVSPFVLILSTTKQVFTGKYLGVSFFFVLWPKNRRLRLFLCRSDTTWEEQRTLEEKPSKDIRQTVTKAHEPLFRTLLKWSSMGVFPEVSVTVGCSCMRSIHRKRLCLECGWLHSLKKKMWNNLL